MREREGRREESTGGGEGQTALSGLWAEHDARLFLMTQAEPNSRTLNWLGHPGTLKQASLHTTLATVDNPPFPFHSDFDVFATCKNTSNISSFQK